MRFAFNRAGGLLILALAALPAGASSFDLGVDPRFELLAVVRQLSGAAGAGDEAGGHAARVEKRFGALRGHPAVALYRDLAASPSREEAAATILLYHSNPPELALKDVDADVHYVNGPGEAEEMQRFVSELRDFARVSGFADFFRDNRGYYAELEAAARARLGAVDPVAEIERYLGLSLASRSHYVIMPQRAPTHAFIIPYPLPPANAGAGSFDVYTMSPDLLTGAFAQIVWPEPLFVFVDPAFYYFEKLNIPDPAAFYGPEVARCRAASPDCVKHYAVTAIIERLNREAGIPPVPGAAGARASAAERRLISALSARLGEYEADRVRYPTLWHFLPRWFSVFEERAFPRRARRRLFVPAEPRLSSAADFFDPATAERLLRAAAP